MAKTSLSKIALIKNINPKAISVEGQEVLITQYLPMQEKLALMERILSVVVDDTGFINPVKLEIYSNLEIIRAYTNISITDKMMEDPCKIYDLLTINNLLRVILGYIPSDEYSDLINWIQENAENIGKYTSSFLHVLKTISSDYSETKIDVDSLMKTLDDPEKIGFVKDILEKIG